MRSVELTLLLVILVAGCGGGPSASLKPPPDPTPTPAPPPPPPAATGVMVSCTPASVLSNGTSQCFAIVAPPTATQAVTWKAFTGAMTATGLYTAPNSTIVFTDTVVAFVASNPSISGNFSITVTPPAPPPPPATSVSVTCPLTVKSGATALCTAVVAPPDASQTVTWGVTPLGTITQLGGLTAPTVTTDTNIVVSAAAVNINVVGHATVDVLAPSSPPPSTGPIVMGIGSSPFMVVDSNGAIDIAWDTGTGVDFRHSVDGGTTFSNAVMVIPQPIPGDFVEMQVDASNAIVIFSSYQGPNDPDPIPQMARSTDGVNFKTFPVPTHGLDPELAVEPSGAIDFAWFGFGDKALHEIRSTDGGVTYSPTKTIWSTPDDVLDVDMATGPQGQLYLFFGHEGGPLGCDVFFSASLDGSQTFSTPKSISASSGGCNANQIPLVDAAGNINVAWDDARSVFFARSADQGQTFTVSTVVTETFNTGDEQFTVGPNGDIDLAFASQGSGGFNTFFTQSKDQGVTFATPVQLNNLPSVLNFTGASGPVVGVDSSGKITVVWSDDAKGAFSGDDDLYTSTSTDGVNFSTPTNLTNTTDQSELVAQVLVTKSGVHYFLWYDTASFARPVTNVFFDAVP
jgi:hypothetical protein